MKYFSAADCSHPTIVKTEIYHLREPRHRNGISDISHEADEGIHEETLRTVPSLKNSPVIVARPLGTRRGKPRAEVRGYHKTSEMTAFK